MAISVLRSLSKIFNRNAPQQDVNNHLVVQAHEHSLNPKVLCKHALEVVRTLQDHKFEAYLVGGCIRDLLLGLNPKDFDVATNAEPHQVKHIFRRARIVGRRFQIVHVQFGRNIIEVTTFRSNTNKIGPLSANKNLRLQQSESGLLTRDNVFGSIKDDANRRDLTINALYYDPIQNAIHDFCHGLEDLEKRTIRIIGDPATRYREDPVRLLRVARFAAKLGFHVDTKTLKPMAKMTENLSHVSAPRMFDETLKLFMSGQGLATFKLLIEYGLFANIVPQANRLIEQGHHFTIRMVEQALTNTDLRIRSKKKVTPAFIYAALLWPSVQKIASEYQKQGHSPSLSLNKAADEVIVNQIPITAIPKRFTLAMREIWYLQLMLVKRGGNKARRLSEHPRFRAAYDFTLLREQAGEDLNGLGEWWTTYQEVSEDEQQKMVEVLSSDRARKRRPRRRRRRNTDA